VINSNWIHEPKTKVWKNSTVPQYVLYVVTQGCIFFVKFLSCKPSVILYFLTTQWAMWYYTCILNFLGLKLCPADLSNNPTPETLKKLVQLTPFLLSYRLFRKKTKSLKTVLLWLKGLKNLGDESKILWTHSKSIVPMNLEINSLSVWCSL